MCLADIWQICEIHRMKKTTPANFLCIFLVFSPKNCNNLPKSAVFHSIQMFLHLQNHNLKQETWSSSFTLPNFLNLDAIKITGPQYWTYSCLIKFPTLLSFVCDQLCANWYICPKSVKNLFNNIENIPVLFKYPTYFFKLFEI